MSCLNCKRHFIFDPKRHANGSKSLTDAYFIKCIEKLSQNHTYYYTEDELYCFMAQQTQRSLAGCLFGAAFLTFFLTCILHALFQWGITPVFLLIPLLVFMAVRVSNKTLSRRKWAKFLNYWRKQCKKFKYEDDQLSGMITSPQLIEKPQPASEPDIYDYGAAKLLICEHDIQVDWLVMNKFHAENGIVIISENFYPEYLTDKVKELINTNPELEIYALHNAGYHGEKMVSRLRDPLNKWQLGGKEIVDLGVSMEHLAKTKIKDKIIAQYSSNFPAHGIMYHQFSQTLNHCLVTGVTFAAAYAALHSDTSTSVSGDFG